MTDDPATPADQPPAQPSGQRPGGFVKPAHWSNEPAPAPAPIENAPDPAGLSPTRYGDWEKNGIAIDF